MGECQLSSRSTIHIGVLMSLLHRRWYASTEVLRDLTDKSRYNMLLPVANILGIDMDDDPLWRDEVMTILNKAIHHSFKAAKVAIVDNHTLLDGFNNWYNSEMKTRRYCPVNWKWVRGCLTVLAVFATLTSWRAPLAGHTPHVIVDK